jgi:hypothetical protein
MNFDFAEHLIAARRALDLCEKALNDKDAEGGAACARGAVLSSINLVGSCMVIQANPAPFWQRAPKPEQLC